MDLREYKLMVVLGALVAVVGLLAIYFETMLAGGLAIAVGGILALSGMVGALWNQD
jgi:hypothetical protein